MFTTFDMLALGTVVICTVLSALRGMISELLDFGGWIVSLLLARALAAPVAASVFPAMQPRAMAVVCSFVLVFIAVRLFQHLLRFALNSAISKAKLTRFNRMMGGVCGALKGILFVSIAVFVCSFSNLPYSDSWRNAASSEFFETLVKASVPYLPEIFADQVHFPARTLPEAPVRPRKRQVEKLTPKAY